MPFQPNFRSLWNTFSGLVFPASFRPVGPFVHKPSDLEPFRDLFVPFDSFGSPSASGFDRAVRTAAAVFTDFSYLCEKRRGTEGRFYLRNSDDGFLCPTIVENPKYFCYEQLHLSESYQVGLRQGADRPPSGAYSCRPADHDHLWRRQRQAKRRLRSGLKALDGRNFIEFWGIEANPLVETLRKAIALGKEHKVDFLLAVGGGSVIDGTKLISPACFTKAMPGSWFSREAAGRPCRWLPS